MPIDPTDRQLSYEIELLKIYVALAAAIVGGSIGLLLGELTTLKLCLATLGIGVTITLSWKAGTQDKLIRTLIWSTHHDTD